MTDKITIEEMELDVKPNVQQDHDWHNKDNIPLYNSMPIDVFYNIAASGDLDTGCDVALLSHYIEKANSILEVGGGYGRVLTHILNQGYSKNLCAIERTEKLARFLQSQFYGRAKIFKSDILQFETTERFDLILWLWTGIAEFAKDEQEQAIAKLASLLTERGHIIIDTVPIDERTINTTQISGQNHIIETAYGIDHCYLTSLGELEKYAKNQGLQLKCHLVYKTRINRQRFLSVFYR